MEKVYLTDHVILVVFKLLGFNRLIFQDLQALRLVLCLFKQFLAFSVVNCHVYDVNQMDVVLSTEIVVVVQVGHDII